MTVNNNIKNNHSESVISQISYALYMSNDGDYIIDIIASLAYKCPTSVERYFVLLLKVLKECRYIIYSSEQILKSNDKVQIAGIIKDDILKYKDRFYFSKFIKLLLDLNYDVRINKKFLSMFTLDENKKYLDIIIKDIENIIKITSDGEVNELDMQKKYRLISNKNLFCKIFKYLIRYYHHQRTVKNNHNLDKKFNNSLEIKVQLFDTIYFDIIKTISLFSSV